MSQYSDPQRPVNTRAMMIIGLVAAFLTGSAASGGAFLLMARSDIHHQEASRVATDIVYNANLLQQLHDGETGHAVQMVNEALSSDVQVLQNGGLQFTDDQRAAMQKALAPLAHFHFQGVR